MDSGGGRQPQQCLRTAVDRLLSSCQVALSVLTVSTNVIEELVYVACDRESAGGGPNSGQLSLRTGRLLHVIQFPKPGGPAMPILYIGVFCPDKHFNVVETYAVAHLRARALVDWVVSGQGQCRCGQCGKVFSFQQRDVAHSNCQDGREPQYPHKLAAILDGPLRVCASAGERGSSTQPGSNVYPAGKKIGRLAPMRCFPSS